MEIKKVLATLLIVTSFSAISTTYAANDSLDSFLSSLWELENENTTTIGNSDMDTTWGEIDLDSLEWENTSNWGIEYEPEGEEYNTYAPSDDSSVYTNTNNTTSDISAPVNLDARLTNAESNTQESVETTTTRELSSTGTNEVIMTLITIMLLSGFAFIKYRRK